MHRRGLREPVGRESYVLLCSLVDGRGALLLLFVSGIRVVQHSPERVRTANYLFEGPARTRDADMGPAACKGGEERICLR